MMEALPAMFVNGQIVPTNECPGSAADMLLKFVKGPYTAARISGGKVQSLDRHLARLAEAVMKLHHCGRVTFEIMSSINSAAADENLQQLCALLRQRMQSGLDAAIACVTGTKSTTAALTVLLAPSDASTASMTGVSDVQPDRQDFDVVVHVGACAEPPQSPKGVEVRVVGMSRPSPSIKHSQWVVDRQVLKQHFAPNTAEGLLCNDKGCLLEGMITNFFIVTDDGQGGSCVVTAAIGDGILGGVMRLTVLQACSALGISVKEQAPHWSTHQTWQEAFLTNSLRPLQPVNRVVCDVPGLCGDTPWEITLPNSGQFCVTDNLRQQVLSSLSGD